jgi:hypothetical protein
VNTATLFFSVLFKLINENPHLYYLKSNNIVGTFCGKESGLSFGSPNLPIMMQMSLNLTIFLSIFFSGLSDIFDNYIYDTLQS